MKKRPKSCDINLKDIPPPDMRRRRKVSLYSNSKKENISRNEIREILGMPLLGEIYKIKEFPRTTTLKEAEEWDDNQKIKNPVVTKIREKKSC